MKSSQALSMSTKKTGVFRYIFYSLLSLALILLGFGCKPELSREFLEQWPLWQNAIAAGVFCGLGMAILGVYILLSRIVFVGLALSQGAGLGILLAFWLGGLLGLSHEALSERVFDIPFWAGMAMAMLCAGLFSNLRRYKSFSEGSLTGLIYVLCSGFIVLVADQLSEGKHEVDHLFYGSAVAVDAADLKLIGVVSAAILLAHLIFRRAFLYVSADPTFMKTLKMPTRLWSALLYLLFSLGITAALKTLGALPVFALLLIPPFIALRSAASLPNAFGIAVLLGVVLPLIGYYYSHLFDLPTGATLIAAGCVFLLGSLGERRILKRVFGI